MGLTASIRRHFSTAFSQMGVKYALLHICAKVSQRLFDQHCIPSYSQFGEDRIIDAFFQGKREGFYVDVGCNRPIAYSNTWLLYKSGWRGVVIDANPDVIAMFSEVRPRDLSETAVVSDRQREVDFFTSRVSDLISGIGEKTDGFWQRTDDNSQVSRRHTITLQSILERNQVPRDFDLLSVDVEGEDLGVLRSLDLVQFRPRLIVVEIHGFDLAAPARSDLYRHLAAQQYELIGYSRPSAFFQRTT